MAGAALCEPSCADFVAGAVLCEPPCALCAALAACRGVGCTPLLFGRPPGVLVRITVTAHGLNTFRQDRQMTTHQDGARFYGTLYMGMTRDANGVELVTVDRP